MPFVPAPRGPGLHFAVQHGHGGQGKPDAKRHDDRPEGVVRGRSEPAGVQEHGRARRYRASFEIDPVVRGKQKHRDRRCRDVAAIWRTS